ncbi:MAG: hypothetical protein ABIQ73_11805 [Acidimicrobiales bacterium]
MSHDTGKRDGPGAEQQFSLSFDRCMRVLMTPLLAGPRYCRVAIAAGQLDVAMGVGGWAFAATVARSAIADVCRISGRAWSWGAHGWRGRWLVNGSSRGLVRLTIDPPGRARCLGVPVKLRELALSLDDPDGFVAALSSPL